MSDPVIPDPDPELEDDATISLPVELDLETPEADALEQSIAVELDVEGHSYG